MKYIDMTNDPRNGHFDYFRSLPYPYMGVTVNVDVTELVSVCREKKLYFYLAFMHLTALAADGVPELRRRIQGEVVAEYESCPTSHIELLENGSYCYCTLKHDMPWREYYLYALNARELSRTNASIEEEADVDGFYFVSSLPWLNYTALVQPVACNDESNPRITWGKFAPDSEGRLMMPLSILAHHALADGSHIAAFYDNVAKEMKRLICEIREEEND